mmetsp:Transcript_28134/g.80859  ORF Transcript_28134/g.80859 Transcript_28134/m.80859 type:complete len:278 (+) Transcript_28134:1259-2092(+)
MTVVPFDDGIYPHEGGPPIGGWRKQPHLVRPRVPAPLAHHDGAHPGRHELLHATLEVLAGHRQHAQAKALHYPCHEFSDRGELAVRIEENDSPARPGRVIGSAGRSGDRSQAGKEQVKHDAGILAAVEGDGELARRGIERRSPPARRRAHLENAQELLRQGLARLLAAGDARSRGVQVSRANGLGSADARGAGAARHDRREARQRVGSEAACGRGRRHLCFVGDGGGRRRDGGCGGCRGHGRWRCAHHDAPGGHPRQDSKARLLVAALYRKPQGANT